jgi:hypothetical protein
MSQFQGQFPKRHIGGRSGVAAILQVDFKSTTKEQANGQAVDWLNADR